MATYKSPEISFGASAETVYAKLSNIEGLKSIIASIPEEKLQKEHKEALEKLEITSDSITFPGGPVGSLTLKVEELKEPSLIKLKGVGTPVPLTLAMHIRQDGESASKGEVAIDLEIPALLKPMIGGQIQKMADQFGQMLKSIKF